MSKDIIPFNRPFIIGKELHYISQAVIAGKLAGGGDFTARCTEWIGRQSGAHKVLLTGSCTAALEMSAILTRLKPGDEVILPSFTFVSTANAFAMRGARLRFVDIRPDTLNLDEKLVEEAVRPGTRAIVAVHYSGVACELDALLDIARRHDLLLIEDAAQGVGATYKGRSLGTIGHLGCYSFHETKNIISGEGGALLVNDSAFSQRAEVIWQKGTDRNRFLRGEVDKYTWVDEGSSFLPSELIAAFLFAQLEESERITTRRTQIFDYYFAGLRPLQDAGHVRLPWAPDHCRHNAHMFYLLTESGSLRDRLLAYLREHGVYAVFHYVPLHSSQRGLAAGYTVGSMQVTDETSARLLRLPCFFELTEAEQARVIDLVTRFFR